MQQLSTHELHESVDHMLSPETLSRLLGHTITQVVCQPFQSQHGFSGNRLYKVTAGDIQLVMKQLTPATDWISIATDDHQCRSLRVWQYGILDRVQPYLAHATVAACRDGDDYAILMHDVSDGLFHGKEITTSTIHRLLESLAAMHAIYWEEDALKAPHLGLCNAEQLVSMGWPVHFDRYRHDTRAIDYGTKGWSALFDLVEADVRDILISLMHNPQPLFERLAQYPSTFIHGDYRLGNLAMLPETNRIVALDWQDAGFAPATICLCWFLMSGEVFGMQEEAAEYYRQQLALRLGKRFNHSLWQEMLDIGCLVEVLRKGSWHALFALYHHDEGFRTLMKESVGTYNTIVRQGAKWL